MSSINSTGTYVTLIVVGLYTVFVITRHFIRGNNSMRNTEAIHRFFIFSGGILLGLGITLLTSTDDEALLNNDVYFGILTILAALALVSIGIVYLRGGLIDPLVQISEYSAEFGESFIATRLPTVGGIELSSFSERFNTNVRSLANKISLIEIHLDRLSESVNSSIENGLSMSNEIQNLSEIALNYSELTGDQEGVVRNIGSSIHEFVDWYETSQTQLEENFVELRSLAEMGNLISVNAAVETSNLEFEHPGLTTLAEKLHDLARSLEIRQEEMRRLIDDINFRYSDFRSNVEEYVDRAIQINQTTSDLGDRVDDMVKSISNRQSVYISSTNRLKDQFNKFKNDLPRSY